SVFFEYFKDSYLDFRLMGWLNNARLEPRVKSDLHYGIDKSFREAGIEFAFPQLDLHLHNGLEEHENSESSSI
ncbi:MAG TPA: hypothetical protein VK074_09700, partial [Fodinibius sp.]|nr:hypothetical protein [Fodinibius sp.]